MSEATVPKSQVVRQLQSIIDQMDDGVTMTSADKAMAAQFAIKVMIAGLSEGNQQ